MREHWREGCCAALQTCPSLRNTRVPHCQFSGKTRSGVTILTPASRQWDTCHFNVAKATCTRTDFGQVALHSNGGKNRILSAFLDIVNVLCSLPQQKCDKWQLRLPRSVLESNRSTLFLHMLGLLAGSCRASSHGPLLSAAAGSSKLHR